MPLMHTKIDTYTVLYFSNKTTPFISLRADDKVIGVLIFHPNGIGLPLDRVQDSGARMLNYHREDFHNIIDLLRNESPVYLRYMSEGTNQPYGDGITTDPEMVGEGELQLG